MHVLDRLHSKAQQWNVTVTDVRDTPSSLIGFGVRGSAEVVLKLAKQAGDEWLSGEVLRAFHGDGIVRVLEADDGAALLQRLRPGTQLVELVHCGNDDGATEILGQVIKQLSHHEAPTHCPTVTDWAGGFDRYLASQNEQIPTAIVTEARELYVSLASSQCASMLLHGDLHHYNVLFDTELGWVAIDPKGVVGELEYEIGPLLRNPIENSELVTSRATVKRRLNILVASLELDYQRTVLWAYAQAVLSAIWEIEDNRSLNPDNPALKLAEVLRPMLVEHLRGM